MIRSQVRLSLTKKIERRLCGKLHSNNGLPAIEFVNGDKHWYQNDKLHREDGPAIESPDGKHEWWANGLQYRKEDFEKLLLQKDDMYNIIRIDDRIEWYLDSRRHREDGPAIVWDDGDQDWYQNDKRHREDGPAVERKNGTKSWFLHGQRHRNNGPAVSYPDGSEEWWRDGVLHRTDGPAIKRRGGSCEWWIWGHSYSKEQFEERLNLKDKADKILVKTSEADGDLNWTEPTTKKNLTIKSALETITKLLCEYPELAEKTADVIISVENYQQVQEKLYVE